MADGEREAIIQAQFVDLQAKYPSLCLLQNALGTWIIRGPLHFSASYRGLDLVDDEYTIELALTEKFPQGIPTRESFWGVRKNFILTRMGPYAWEHRWPYAWLLNTRQLFLGLLKTA